MTWLYILIGITAAVFLISKLGGSSNSDAAANAGGAAYAVGGCMLQIFLTLLGIALIFWIGGWLFS